MSLPDHAGPIFTQHDLGHAIAHLRRCWAWFIAFGAMTAALGLCALGLTATATFASVYLIALFIIFVGGSEIILGVNSHLWGNRLLLTLVGLLYVVTGSFALAHPLTGAAGFTLLLGVALAMTGVVRMYFAMQMPHGPSGFVALAGLLTTVLGLSILFGWPENSIYVLGVFLGVDLVFYGASWIGFGLFLRKG